MENKTLYDDIFDTDGNSLCEKHSAEWNFASLPTFRLSRSITWNHDRSATQDVRLAVVWYTPENWSETSLDFFDQLYRTTGRFGLFCWCTVRDLLWPKCTESSFCGKSPWGASLVSRLFQVAILSYGNNWCSSFRPELNCTLGDRKTNCNA